MPPSITPLPPDLRTVRVEHGDGGIATVTLSRPERLNALDDGMTGELTDVLAALDADPAVRGLVLTGAGRGFCSGADVGMISAMAAAGVTAEQVDAVFAAAMRMGQTLFELATPVVAAVNGPAAGAGASIAAGCDFLLMAQDATIAFIFAKRGLVPDWGATWLLPRLVGLAKARELAYFGEPLGAEAAVACGLALRAVPAADLLAEARALAARLAAGPSVATGLTKRLLAEGSRSDFATAMQAEFAAQRRCFATADAIEGATAFLQRRPAVFTGR